MSEKGEDKRDLEEALRESAESYRNLFDAVFEGIAIHDGGKIIDVNEALSRMLGYEREEMIGASILEFAPEEWHEEVMRNVRSGFSQPYEAVGLRKDGTRIPIELVGKSHNYRGRVVRLTALRDITEAHRAERALRESENRYRTLVETSPDAIVVTDLQGRYIMANQRAVELFGATSVDDMIGRDAYEMVEPDSRDLARQSTLEALVSGEVRSTVYTFVTLDGRRFSGEVGASVIADVDGSPRAMMAVLRDVTETQKAKQILADERKRLAIALDELEERHGELMEANLQLERLDAAKDEFIAMVSHELRTPLVTGLGYIELLLDGRFGPISPQVTNRMEGALKNLWRLSGLIDNILNYQSFIKHEYRAWAIENAVDLPPLCRESVSEFVIRTGFTEKNVSVDMPADLPPVRGDATMLRMVFSNLLDNAARHAGDGCRLMVQAARNGGRDDAPVTVSISDDGRGMSETEKKSAFEPFFKGGEQGEGSGLGLAIVRGILKAHGAEPEIDTAPGRGTTVRFTLGLAGRRPSSGTIPVPAERSAEREAPGTILVVEDDPDTLTFLETVLGRDGYTARMAESAERALGMLEEGPIDLFLLDVRLPGMDGAELCRRIKADERFRGVPVLMFTARAEPKTRRLAEESGCDGYIVKPIVLEEFRNAVRSAMQSSGGRQP